MPIENSAPNSGSDRPRSSPSTYGYRMPLILGSIGLVGSLFLVIQAYITADNPHVTTSLALVAMCLGLLGILFLLVPSAEPETFPAFLAKRPRVMAGFSLVGGLMLAVTVSLMTFIPFRLSLTTLIVSVLLSTMCILMAWYGAREALAPARRTERERRQKLLASIEVLAEEDPKLYAVAQLVRDDIAISSRQSGRQSLFQNIFFFLVGVAVPYAIQFIAPHIQTWLNLK